MRFTEWCQELEAALAEPFRPDQIRTKEVQGTQIAYVSWHHYVQRLNELVGPGWSIGTPIIAQTEPSQKTIKARENQPARTVAVPARLVIGVPVTILGVTRINFGDESEGKDDYGTPSTNAFAQGLKRTLALFGMGLDMYDKEARIAMMRGASKSKPEGAARDGYYASEQQKEQIRTLLKAKKTGGDVYKRITTALTKGFTADEAKKTIAWLKRQPDLLEAASQ